MVKETAKGTQEEYIKGLVGICDGGKFRVFDDSPNKIRKRIEELTKKIRHPMDPKSQTLRKGLDRIYKGVAYSNYESIYGLFCATGIPLTEETAQRMYNQFIFKDFSKFTMELEHYCSYSKGIDGIWAAIRLKDHCEGPIPKLTGDVKKVFSDLKRKSGEEYQDNEKFKQAYDLLKDFIKGKRALIPSDIMADILSHDFNNNKSAMGWEIYYDHRGDGKMKKVYSTGVEGIIIPRISDKEYKLSDISSLIKKLDSSKGKLNTLAKKREQFQNIIDSYNGEINCNLGLSSLFWKGEKGNPGFKGMIKLDCENIRDPRDLKTIVQIDEEVLKSCADKVII